MTMTASFSAEGGSAPGGEKSIKSKEGFDVIENGYERYVALGGIINKKDYDSALQRAQHTTTPENRHMVAQAEGMAKHAGIALEGTNGALDSRTILYGILRDDAKPKDVEYHHSQMNDQRLFAESLRMLGDEDSLNKLIAAYPNISF